jgi:formylglycine-generating enzyme required for sulfatase activity
MATGTGGITRSGSDGSYTYAAIAGREKMPVNRVSYFDALPFVNWLHNGQGSGDTETGAYTLHGGTPTPSNPMVQRNPGAFIFLPTDDEWYKAAYYDTGGGDLLRLSDRHRLPDRLLHAHRGFQHGQLRRGRRDLAR